MGEDSPEIKKVQQPLPRKSNFHHQFDPSQLQAHRTSNTSVVSDDDRSKSPTFYLRDPHAVAFDSKDKVIVSHDTDRLVARWKKTRANKMANPTSQNSYSHHHDQGLHERASLNAMRHGVHHLTISKTLRHSPWDRTHHYSPQHSSSQHQVNQEQIVQSSQPDKQAHHTRSIHPISNINNEVKLISEGITSLEVHEPLSTLPFSPHHPPTPVTSHGDHKHQHFHPNLMLRDEVGHQLQQSPPSGTSAPPSPPTMTSACKNHLALSPVLEDKPSSCPWRVSSIDAYSAAKKAVWLAKFAEKIDAHNALQTKSKMKQRFNKISSTAVGGEGVGDRLNSTSSDSVFAAHYHPHSSRDNVVGSSGKRRKSLSQVKELPIARRRHFSPSKLNQDQPPHKKSDSNDSVNMNPSYIEKDDDYANMDVLKDKLSEVQQLLSKQESESDEEDDALIRARSYFTAKLFNQQDEQEEEDRINNEKDKNSSIEMRGRSSERTGSIGRRQNHVRSASPNLEQVSNIIQRNSYSLPPPRSTSIEPSRSRSSISTNRRSMLLHQSSQAAQQIIETRQLALLKFNIVDIDSHNSFLSSHKSTPKSASVGTRKVMIRQQRKEEELFQEHSYSNSPSFAKTGRMGLMKHSTMLQQPIPPSPPPYSQQQHSPPSMPPTTPKMRIFDIPPTPQSPGEMMTSPLAPPSSSIRNPQQPLHFQPLSSAQSSPPVAPTTRVRSVSPSRVSMTPPPRHTNFYSNAVAYSFEKPDNGLLRRRSRSRSKQGVANDVVQEVKEKDKTSETLEASATTKKNFNKVGSSNQVGGRHDTNTTENRGGDGGRGGGKGVSTKSTRRPMLSKGRKADSINEFASKKVTPYSNEDTSSKSSTPTSSQQSVPKQVTEEQTSPAQTSQVSDTSLTLDDFDYDDDIDDIVIQGMTSSQLSSSSTSSSRNISKTSPLSRMGFRHASSDDVVVPSPPHSSNSVLATNQKQQPSATSSIAADMELVAASKVIISPNNNSAAALYKNTRKRISSDDVLTSSPYKRMSSDDVVSSSSSKRSAKRSPAPSPSASKDTILTSPSVAEAKPSPTTSTASKKAAKPGSRSPSPAPDGNNDDSSASVAGNNTTPLEKRSHRIGKVVSSPIPPVSSATVTEPLTTPQMETNKAVPPTSSVSSSSVTEPLTTPQKETNKTVPPTSSVSSSTVTERLTTPQKETIKAVPPTSSVSSSTVTEPLTTPQKETNKVVPPTSSTRKKKKLKDGFEEKELRLLDNTVVTIQVPKTPDKPPPPPPAEEEISNKRGSVCIGTVIGTRAPHMKEKCSDWSRKREISAENALERRNEEKQLKKDGVFVLPGEEEDSELKKSTKRPPSISEDNENKNLSDSSRSGGNSSNRSGKGGDGQNKDGTGEDDYEEDDEDGSAPKRKGSVCINGSLTGTRSQSMKEKCSDWARKREISAENALERRKQEAGQNALDIYIDDDDEDDEEDEETQILLNQIKTPTLPDIPKISITQPTVEADQNSSSSSLDKQTETFEKNDNAEKKNKPPPSPPDSDATTTSTSVGAPKSSLPSALKSSSLPPKAALIKKSMSFNESSLTEKARKVSIASPTTQSRKQLDAEQGRRTIRSAVSFSESSSFSSPRNVPDRTNSSGGGGGGGRFISQTFALFSSKSASQKNESPQNGGSISPSSKYNFNSKDAMVDESHDEFDDDTGESSDDSDNDHDTPSVVTNDHFKTTMNKKKEEDNDQTKTDQVNESVVSPPSGQLISQASVEVIVDDVDSDEMPGSAHITQPLFNVMTVGRGGLINLVSSHSHSDNDIKVSSNNNSPKVEHGLNDVNTEEAAEEKVVIEIAVANTEEAAEEKVATEIAVANTEEAAEEKVDTEIAVANTEEAAEEKVATEIAVADTEEAAEEKIETEEAVVNTEEAVEEKVATFEALVNTEEAAEAKVETEIAVANTEEAAEEKVATEIAVANTEEAAEEKIETEEAVVNTEKERNNNNMNTSVVIPPDVIPHSSGRFNIVPPSPSNSSISSNSSVPPSPSGGFQKSGLKKTLSKSELIKRDILAKKQEKVMQAAAAQGKVDGVNLTGVPAFAVVKLTPTTKKTVNHRGEELLISPPPSSASMSGPNWSAATSSLNPTPTKNKLFKDAVHRIVALEERGLKKVSPTSLKPNTIEDSQAKAKSLYTLKKAVTKVVENNRSSRLPPPEKLEKIKKKKAVKFSNLKGKFENLSNHRNSSNDITSDSSFDSVSTDYLSSSFDSETPSSSSSSSSSTSGTSADEVIGLQRMIRKLENGQMTPSKATYANAAKAATAVTPAKTTSNNTEPIATTSTTGQEITQVQVEGGEGGADREPKSVSSEEFWGQSKDTQNSTNNDDGADEDALNKVVHDEALIGITDPKVLKFLESNEELKAAAVAAAAQVDIAISSANSSPAGSASEEKQPRHDIISDQRTN